MASKKKEETAVVEEEIVETNDAVTSETVKKVREKKSVKPAKDAEAYAESITSKKQKYEIGSIVYIAKDAEADLNGFKLFPQYKKYTYTVEAYDDKSGVYTLRKLNLTLSLKEDSIVSPDERAHDSLNRKQF